MNLTEQIIALTDKLKDIEQTKYITEAKGHMDHPEDLVLLDGTAGAKRALKAMVDTYKNPKTISIKWDGYPALIWGYGPDNKFSIMDKHMFNKGTNSPARYIHSPQQFIQYDLNRGRERTGLGELISMIWPELQQRTPKKKGYIWGDLLFDQPLKPQKDGMYHFKANPNGISYTVKANSPVGQAYFKDKRAGIAVHQFLDVTAEDTDNPATKYSLNGTTGGMGEGKYVSILPAAMPETPKLKPDTSLINKAKTSIATNGRGLNTFLRSAPKTRKGASPINGILTKYINSKIKKRNLNNLTADFIPFVKEEAQKRLISGEMSRALLGYIDPATNKHIPGYIEQNMNALQDVFQVWIDIYNLKMNIVPQLDKAAEIAPVQGYLQDGTRSQEGFVSQGLKFVNRFGFSAQNLQGR